MRINLIRHGKTSGNLEKRYIGRTDEPLCADGMEEIKNNRYPLCDAVIASPMKRCIQTADIIYPDKEIIICDDLRECDFGAFEGKNYTELSGNPDYQKWIDSNATMPFPDGEDPQNFRKRCVDAFRKTAGMFSGKILTFVVHGGTIMAVMEKLAVPSRSYYSWQVKNGRGFAVEYDGKKIILQEEI